MRPVLRAASVLGRRFSIPVLAHMVGQDPADCVAELDAAAAAGLVEAIDDRREQRFVHALVRDAVVTDLPGLERARLHRSAADALEATGGAGSTGGPGLLADLARHRAAAAVAAPVGDRRLAVTALVRAADDAMRRLAFEEGAALYAQALDVGATGSSPEEGGVSRARLTIALVDARRRSADEAGALEACGWAAEDARRADRPDLLAEAALAVGCLREPDRDRVVLALCDEVLTGLGPEPSALRARVLALRAETGTFLGDTVGAESASAEALDIAGATADRGALIAALRVRRTVRSGPEGLDDRIAVADRLAALAAESDDPDVGLDAHLARFEVALERGDLAAARAELEPIAGRVHGVGGPIARWRLLTRRATTAQAHGRLLEARRLGEEALATLGATPHPAAEAMRVALHGAIDHHLGPAAGPRSALDALTARPAPEAPAVGYRFFDALGAAVLLTDLGRLADAASYYRALGPPGAWRPPPFFAVASRAVAVAVAVAQDDPADVAVLRDHLRPHRDRHVAVPGGTANYGGPVALPLGRASATLGELDDAVDDLEFALSTCSRIGAAGYAVESGEALAPSSSGATVAATGSGPADSSMRPRRGRPPWGWLRSSSGSRPSGRASTPGRSSPRGSGRSRPGWPEDSPTPRSPPSSSSRNGPPRITYSTS